MSHSLKLSYGKDPVMCFSCISVTFTCAQNIFSPENYFVPQIPYFYLNRKLCSSFFHPCRMWNFVVL